MQNPARGNKVDYGEYERSLLCACVCSAVRHEMFASI